MRLRPFIQAVGAGEEFQSPVRSVGVVLVQWQIPVTVALEWARRESQGQPRLDLHALKRRKIVALASSEALLLVAWVYTEGS